MLSPDILVFLHFFLAEPHFSVGSPFFDVLEKVDMSAVFHFHAPLPLHKSAVYSMSKFIYGVGGGTALSNNGPGPSPKSFSRWLLLNVTVFFGLKPSSWGGDGVDTIGQEVGQEKSHFFSSSVRIQPRPLWPTAGIVRPHPESGICWAGIL